MAGSTRVRLITCDDLRTRLSRRKGATNSAIGLVRTDPLRGLLRNERRVLTISRMQTGAAGLNGVALLLPAGVGAGGAAEVLEPEMSADERARLEHSADVLRRAVRDLA